MAADDGVEGGDFPAVDTALFRLINGKLHTPAADAAMRFVTDVDNFIVLIVAASLALAFLGGAKGRMTLIVVGLSVGLSDLFSGMVKDLVARPRPCDALEGVRMLVGCGGAYSFPSAHASNIFAAMVPLAVRVKRAWPAFIALAFTVAYSRVYVGAHYPSDVLAGTVLGTAVAAGFLLLEKSCGGPLRKRLVFGGRGADTGKKNETSGQDKD